MNGIFEYFIIESKEPCEDICFIHLCIHRLYYEMEILRIKVLNHLVQLFTSESSHSLTLTESLIQLEKRKILYVISIYIMYIE